MKPFTRATERFRIYGIDLNNPTDNTQPGYVPVLENVRSYTDGVIEPRLGLTLINTVSSSNKTPVHSIRRLNDPNSGSWIRVVGVQDTLSFMNSTSTASTFTRATYNGSDVALSGNPLALIPYRPNQSPSSWMYVGDSTAMRKIVGYNSQSLTGGTVHQIGVEPPAAPPVVTLGSAANGAIIATNTLGSAPNDWEVDGVVFSRTSFPTTATRIPVSPITVTRAIFDDHRTAVSATAGWFNTVTNEATAAACGTGQIITYFCATDLSTLFMLVTEAFSGSSATTISSVIYDNRPTNTGYCIITPAKPLKEIVHNTIVLLNGTVYARVEDIIHGPNETFSIKVWTGATGASTVAANQALAVVPSIRAYSYGYAVDPTAATADQLQDYGSISASGLGSSTNKTGWMQITPFGGIDLSTFSNLSLTNVAISDSDYLHFSLRFSDLSKLSQGRILLDCDNTSLSISNTANNGAGIIAVTTTTAHELSDGDTVFINNHNASTNGTWIITKMSATQFTLNGSTFVANAGAVGTVQPQFKKNFYYRAFSPNDIIAATKAQDTAINTRTLTVQRRQLTRPPGAVIRTLRPGDDPLLPGEEGRDPLADLDPETPTIDTTPTTQTTTGDYQWSELIFRRSDLVPVGELAERGRYHSINAVRIELTMTDTSTVWAEVNSITAFGGYEPDVFELGIPYLYRYRYRVSTTGARSNWSPPSRSGAVPRRTAVSVTVAAPSAAPEVDKIDIQRLGGSLTNWYDIGTTTTSSLTFTDKVSDMFALGSAPYVEDDINYKPWPVSDVPFSTTATNVTGSYIITSAALPTNLAKGTAMRVNGIDTQYVRTVSSGVQIYEIQHSLGTLTNVTVEIPEPIKYGQSLPTLWGPFMGVFFACGDSRNPGTLYWSNGNDPDSSMETNKVEICSPSEPLQNGCMFNGKAYVWSSERMFEIQPIGPNQFTAIDLPSGKGLYSRWGLAVGERIWYLGKDGIYQTGGGDSISITDDTLRPFFVREGNAGIAVNGFNPPDMTQTAKLRLDYYDGYLRFVYQDTAGAMRVLVYTARGEKQGWWPDTYLDGTGVRCFYGEEGSGVHSLLAGGVETNARIYQVAGASDNSGSISCRVRTQSFDGGDRRALKNFGDLIIDADSQGASLNLTGYINNASTSVTLSPAVASTSTSGRTQTIVDSSSGMWFEGRNLALEVSWASALTPKLYLWEPSYLVLPEDAKLRSTYWDDCGLEGPKFFQGIEITCDTNNAARTIRVEYDGGTLADTLTVQHDGLQTKSYAFHPAFTAHNVRLRPTDSNQWEHFSYRWVWQAEPPLADRWESQQTSLGADQFLHMRAAYVTLRSTTAVSLVVTRTEDNNSVTYTIPTTSGQKMKVYVPFQAPDSKGKTFIFVLTSTSQGSTFRLYRDDTTLLAKQWQSNEAFGNRNPFGHIHGQGAAPI